MMTNGDPKGWILISYSHISNGLLAQPSLSLLGELTVYQSLRRPASVSQHYQTSSSLKPLSQLNSNFILETSQDARTKVCSNSFDHMTKMAATPIYGKTLLSD